MAHKFGRIPGIRIARPGLRGKGRFGKHASGQPRQKLELTERQTSMTRLRGFSFRGQERARPPILSTPRRQRPIRATRPPCASIHLDKFARLL
jgi:hypothetical protein